MARFRFVGNLHVGDNFHREGTTGSGDSYQSVSLSVVAAQNNRAFIELFGIKNSVIKTKNTDGDNIEISYSDREDRDVISKVANYKKNVISFDKDDRNEFICSYDAVGFIVDHIDEFKDKKFIVTGQTSLNIYQGTTSHRFQIQNMYLADEDEKPGLKINAEYFYDKDAIDGSDFKEEKKIYFNGYVQDWISKKDLGTDNGGNRYVPQQAILDCSKIDFANERHMKLMNLKLKLLGINQIESETDKIKPTLKKGYHGLNIEFSYQNGAEVEEFTEDMLTETQKELVELGLKKVEDFRPIGQTYGQRVTVWKISNFNLTGDYADGMTDCDDDFEDLIFEPVASVGSLDEIEKKNDHEVMKFDEPSDDDLFS